MNPHDPLPPHLEDLGRQLVAAAHSRNDPPRGQQGQARFRDRFSHLLALALASLLTVPLLLMAGVLGTHATLKKHRVPTVRIERMADVALNQDRAEAIELRRQRDQEARLRQSAQLTPVASGVQSPGLKRSGSRQSISTDAHKRAQRQTYERANDRQLERARCPNFRAARPGADRRPRSQEAKTRAAAALSV